MDGNKYNLNELLLSQIKERDSMLKSLINDISKLNEMYIEKNREKDKKHTRTILSVVGMCFLSITIIISVFFYGYFWSNYTDHSTTNITGNQNTTSSIDGDNNKIIKNKEE